jgi:RimJ/RimL family protein N-acetyltransferase
VVDIWVALKKCNHYDIFFFFFFFFFFFSFCSFCKDFRLRWLMLVYFRRIHLLSMDSSSLNGFSPLDMNGKGGARPGRRDDIQRVHEMIVALATYEKEPESVKTTVESMLRDFEDAVFGFFVFEEASGEVGGFALYHWRFAKRRDCFVVGFEDGLSGTALGRANVCFWRICLWKRDCEGGEQVPVVSFSGYWFHEQKSGKALFMCCVRLGVDHHVARLQWQVLSWNEPALAFYRSFDAEITSDWLNCKLVRAQLEKLVMK